MADLFDAASPTELFKTLVEDSLARQSVRANSLTSYYLVDLLCRFVRPDQHIPFADDADQPLALRLKLALDRSGLEQRVRLRNLGDFTLFVCGYYSDSMQRRHYDIDYYISMGEYVYGSLSQRDDDVFGEVYQELAGKFVPFMDVLAEISERTSTTTSRDLLRLYEKWLRTGSRRYAQLLTEQGIAPNASIRRSFLQ